jgi:hypothetical protein
LFQLPVPLFVSLSLFEAAGVGVELPGECGAGWCAQVGKGAKSPHSATAGAGTQSRPEPLRLFHTATACALPFHHNSNRPTSDMALYRLRLRVEQIEVRSAGSWAAGGRGHRTSRIRPECFAVFFPAAQQSRTKTSRLHGERPREIRILRIGRTMRPTPPRDWLVMHGCRLPCPSLRSVWDLQTAAKLPSSQAVPKLQPASKGHRSNSKLCSLAQKTRP